MVETLFCSVGGLYWVLISAHYLVQLSPHCFLLEFSSEPCINCILFGLEYP